MRWCREQGAGLLLTVIDPEDPLLRNRPAIRRQTQDPLHYRDFEKQHGRHTPWELRGKEALAHIKAHRPDSAWIVCQTTSKTGPEATRKLGHPLQHRLSR